MDTKVSGGRYPTKGTGISSEAREALDWNSALRAIDEKEVSDDRREEAVATIERLISKPNSAPSP